MFNKLHKTKVHAFIDGLLSGLVIAYIANELSKDYREMKKWERVAEESKNIKTA